MRTPTPIGTPLFTATLTEESVGGVVWLPNGRLCTTTVDSHYKVEVWDVVSGNLVQSFTGHMPYPVDTFLPGAANDRPDKRWNTTRIQWSPDGRLIASRVPGDRRRVWEVSSSKEMPSTATSAIDAWSPDGRFFAAVVENHVAIYDLASGRLLAQSQDMGHRSRIVTLAWSPHGDWLACGTGTPNIGYPDDVEICVYEAFSGVLLLRTSGDGAEWISNLAWSPDGKRLAHSSDTVTIAVYEVPSWRHQGTYRIETGLTRALAWSPDGRFIACAGVTAYETGCSVIYIWEVATGATHTIYRGHEEREKNARSTTSALGEIRSTVDQITWTPDGTRIASVGSFSKRENEQVIKIKDVHIWQAVAEA